METDEFKRAEIRSELTATEERYGDECVRLMDAHARSSFSEVRICTERLFELTRKMRCMRRQLYGKDQFGLRFEPDERGNPIKGS